MHEKGRIHRSRLSAARLLGLLLLAVAALACTGNRNVSVGGSVYRSSGGNWGHSLSIGIHSHGRF